MQAIQGGILSRLVAALGQPKTWAWLLGGFAVLVAFPFAYVARYNVLMADDYCFALPEQTSSRLAAWLTTINGRYFDALLHSWYRLYDEPLVEIYPVLLLVVLAAAALALAAALGSRLRDPRYRYAVAAVLFLSVLTVLVSLPEFLYWFASLTPYGLSTSLLLLYLALVLRPPAVPGRDWTRISLTTILLASIIGLHEAMMAAAIATVGLLWLHELVFNRRLSRLFTCNLVVAVGFGLIAASLPGNWVRSGLVYVSEQMSTAESLRRAFTTYPYWRSRELGRVWVTLVAGSALLVAMLENRKALLKSWKEWLYVAGAVYLVAVASFVVPAVLLGDAGYNRIANLQRVILALGFLLVASLAGNLAVAKRRLPDRLIRLLPFVRLAVLVGWLASIAAAKNVHAVVDDLAQGEARGYQAQYYERVTQARNMQQQALTLAPFVHRPKSLSFVDITADPAEPTNICWAKLFGVSSVRIAADAASGGEP